MKLTKQHCWFLIQVAIVAYLIISSCREARVPYEKDARSLMPVRHFIVDSATNTSSFTKKSFINNP